MNQKLVVTRGIPACGKSTYAREWCKEEPLKRIMIERDQLREAIFKQGKTVLDKEKEKVVTEMQKKFIEENLNKGLSVIVSDTNISQKSVNRFRAIVHNYIAVDFEVVYFDDVSLEECIRRNETRQDSVPEKVIRNMHKRLLAARGKFEKRPLNVDLDKDPCYVFDLDGTVQLMNGRNPFDGKRSYTDMPNASVIITLQGLMKAFPECTFIAVSGREQSAWDVTWDALEDFDICPNYLFMREEKDSRKDSIVKAEIYHDLIEPAYNVIAVFDDRNQTVQGWRDLGLHCFQVAPGDF